MEFVGCQEADAGGGWETGILFGVALGFMQPMYT